MMKHGNEGDLVGCIATRLLLSHSNFMITHGKGLRAVQLNQEYAARLGLKTHGS